MQIWGRNICIQVTTSLFLAIIVVRILMVRRHPGLKLVPAHVCYDGFGKASACAIFSIHRRRFRSLAQDISKCNPRENEAINGEDCPMRFWSMGEDGVGRGVYSSTS